jgi:hypothetical protein
MTGRTIILGTEGAERRRHGSMSTVARVASTWNYTS